MRIAIVDDHPVFKSGLQSLIAHVIPNASFFQFNDGDTFIQMYNEIDPKLVFLDIDLPGTNGLEVCSEITKRNKWVHVVIVSLYKEVSLVNLALKNGAKGYIIKENSVEEIVTCIKSILNGRIYISRTIDEEAVLGLFDNSTPLSVFLRISLTKTEKRVIKLISENKSSKEIAIKLFVTEKTIEIYRSRICKKLKLDGSNNCLLVWTIKNANIIAAFDS